MSDELRDELLSEITDCAYKSGIAKWDHIQATADHLAPWLRRKLLEARLEEAKWWTTRAIDTRSKLIALERIPVLKRELEALK